MFEGQVETSERLNLLYDEVTRHYHVIGNLTAAMAKGYVFKVSGVVVISRTLPTRHVTNLRRVRRVYRQGLESRVRTATDIFGARSVSLTIRSGLEIRSPSVSASETGTCGELVVSGKKHECGKRYCNVCNGNREVGHLCYMQSLKNVLPSSDGVLYVFYDFETEQNTRYSDTAKVNVPNLVCIQQICLRCESVDDVRHECEQCSKRKHSFWEDPVGETLTYLCEPRPWVKQIIAIAHNAKAFDLHFIFNSAVFLKWRPELLMSGQKILCMKFENMKFIDIMCSTVFFTEAV